MSNNSQVYKRAQTDLKKKCQGIEINAKSIITVLRYDMEIVDLTQVKGEAQKTMALELVRDVVRDAPIPSEQKASLEALTSIPGPLASTVELVIAGTRGELDINLAVNTAAGCLSACIPLCRSACKK